MPWVRLDDALGDDPRIVMAGPTALGVLVQSLCYSNRNLTDGWVPTTVVRRSLGDRSTPEAEAKQIEVLLEARLFQSRDRDGIAGYQIHEDYVRLQPTREEILRQRSERSRQKSEAGRLGGVASGKARRKQKRSRVEAEDQAAPKQNEAPIPIPIPVQKEKSTDADASASLRFDNEASNEMLDRLFHEIWEAESSTTDRIDAVKRLLPDRYMSASTDRINASERRVHHIREQMQTVNTDRTHERGGGFQRLGTR